MRMQRSSSSSFKRAVNSAGGCVQGFGCVGISYPNNGSHRRGWRLYVASAVAERAVAASVVAFLARLAVQSYF
jgi:hypothetical protein